MVPRKTGRTVLIPVAALGFATLGILTGAAWGEGPKKQKTPVFPLTLYAAAQPEDFIDDQACAECHPEISSEFSKLYHAPLVLDAKLPPDRRGCQACHGPGSAHIANLDEADKIGLNVVRYTQIKPEEVNAACMRCHGSTMHTAQWNRQPHAKAGLSCLSCHTVHYSTGSTSAESKRASAGDIRTAGSAANLETTPQLRSLKASEAALCGACHRREAAEFRRNFHHPVPEGTMVCSDCHEAHPTKKSAGRQPFARGACARCHPETAGPFRYEHDPVAGWTGDGCLECHRPHGSPNPGMLSSFSRGLCAQCHSDLRTTHYPGQTCWNSGCHEAIHGSNSDRTLLTR